MYCLFSSKLKEFDAIPSSFSPSHPTWQLLEILKNTRYTKCVCWHIVFHISFVCSWLQIKIISINHLKCVTSLITNSWYWYRMHCVHDQLSCEIVLLTHPSRNLKAAPLQPPRRRVARFESSSSSDDIRGTTQGGHSGTSGWRRRFPSSSSEGTSFHIVWWGCTLEYWLELDVSSTDPV